MTTLIQYLQYLLNGITLGAIYALIALGYTMVYGILKFINFAHGDILMVGAYAGLFIFTFLLGESTNAAWMLIAFFIAMLLSMAFCALLGMFIERVAYKPLRNANRLAPAIGVSFILSNGAAWLFGAQSRRFPYPFDDTPISIAGLAITPHQILTVLVSVIMMVVLTVFVNKTKMGKAMRATSLDQSTSELMGIDVNKVISLTFAIGSALAAVGGILAAFDFRVYASMGTMTGLKAFVAAVIGGIGNIQGAMLGGLLLGILESIGAPLFGLCGSDHHPACKAGWNSRQEREGEGIMLNFFQLIIIYAGIYALMAIGQNCITGNTGMLSLCHAGFFCIGSYATGIICKTLGLSFWFSLPVAALCSAVVGFLIGVPTLRLKGDYLCIATLGLGEIIRNIATNVNPVGMMAIPRAELFGYQFSSRNKITFIILVWCFVLIAYFLFRQLAHSRIGRAMIAAREDEVAAQSNGINVAKYKIGSFTLGAAIGGTAGCFATAYTLTVQPGSYTFMVSVMVLCMVVLGGMGNLKGVILGAFIIEFIQYFPQLVGLSSVIPAQASQIIYGLVLVIMMICRPQGILGRDNYRYGDPRSLREKIRDSFKRPSKKEA